MDKDFTEFLLVLRRALLMVVRWIEERCEKHGINMSGGANDASRVK